MQNLTDSVIEGMLTGKIKIPVTPAVPVSTMPTFEEMLEQVSLPKKPRLHGETRTMYVAVCVPATTKRIGIYGGYIRGNDMLIPWETVAECRKCLKDHYSHVKGAYIGNFPKMESDQWVRL